jgi:hypothetical protein
MLIVERNITLPTENVRRQVISIINNFVYNNIEKKARLNNWDLPKIKNNLLKKLKSNDDYFYLGNIRTKERVTNKNINFNIYVLPSEKIKGSDAQYYHNPKKDDDKYGEVFVNFDLLFVQKEMIINRIVHELIHGIQKYKSFSKNYSKSVKKVKLTKMDWFIYYTEPAEYEAQIGELMHSIIQNFNKTKRKNTVLYLLKKILLLPREKMKYTVNWYDENDPYLLDMFSNHVEFLYIFINPPYIDMEKLSPNSKKKYKDINKKIELRADKCYKLFKQKLYTVYQNLKEKNK